MELIKTINAPGSLTLLAICLFLGAVFLFVWPKSRRLARHWLLWVSGVYLVLGLPVAATAIADALPVVPRLHQDGDSIHTLIVFDGDNRRARLDVTLNVMRRARPVQLWVLGDEWLVEGLIRGGYPRHTFGHDSRSSNTREQVDWVRAYAAVHREARLTIVASRLQMPRVAALMDAAGLDVDLLASPIDTEPPTSGWRTLLPSYHALRTSRDALYEHAALRYYRWKGWIGGTDVTPAGLRSAAGGS